jgi:glutaredoxin
VTKAIEVTLIGKPGCHLCDEARDAINEVVGEFTERNPQMPVAITEISILDDEALSQKYHDEIPVVLINGKQHTYWKVDHERLARALFALASN